MKVNSYHLYLNCREAAELLSLERELALGLVTRSALRLHLLICRSCRRYRKQLHWLNRFGDHANTAELPLGQLPPLPEPARQRIAAALEQEQRHD